MRVRTSALLLVVSLLLVGATPRAAAQNRSIAVVVSPRNSVSQVQMGELIKLFTGEKRTWSGGVPVKLFTRSLGTVEHDALLKLLKMSETEYKQHWAGRIYQGEAEAEPVALPSNGMAREAVVAIPGAIALVVFTEIKPGMKVLRVNNKLPDEDGYPLHQ